MSWLNRWLAPFPGGNAKDVQPVATLADFPNGFGVADALPISIQRPQSHQNDDYSRTTKQSVLTYKHRQPPTVSLYTYRLDITVLLTTK
jgi:hypothetical protein